jgi:hypothetical protein
VDVEVISAAGSDGGGWAGKSCDSAGLVGSAAQACDLVVLRGEPGQGLGAEVGEVVDSAGGLGESLLWLGGLVLEPSDLRVSRVGAFASLLEQVESLFELGSQVGVGAGAVEGVP